MVFLLGVSPGNTSPSALHLVSAGEPASSNYTSHPLA